MLAVGAVPLYWLARQQLNSWAGLVFAAVYLLFPALQGANLFEFHPVTLATGFLPFAYWYLKQGNFGRFLLFGSGGGLSRSCFLIVGMLGFIFCTQQDRRGLIVVLGGLASFRFLTMVFIPLFRGETHFGLHRYQAWATQSRGA